MEYPAYWVMIGATLLFWMGLIAIISWAYKNKQFDDIEQAKYEMLEEDA